MKHGRKSALVVGPLESSERVFEFLEQPSSIDSRTETQIQAGMVNLMKEPVLSSPIVLSTIKNNVMGDKEKIFISFKRYRYPFLQNDE